MNTLILALVLALVSPGVALAQLSPEEQETIYGFSYLYGQNQQNQQTLQACAQRSDCSRFMQGSNPDSDSLRERADAAQNYMQQRPSAPRATTPWPSFGQPSQPRAGYGW